MLELVDGIKWNLDVFSIEPTFQAASPIHNRNL